MNEQSEQTNTEAPRQGGAMGFLAYWAPPIVIGLLVGLGIVWVARATDFWRSDVDGIVERWEWGQHDANDELADQIAALGPSARSQVVDAFRDTPDEFADLKIWLGLRLLEEPFFDRETLERSARSDDTWARRTAAVALAQRLREEVDPDVVMPGILDWLKDLSTDDHEQAVTALVALGPLPPEWHDRARDALLALATRRPPVGDPDEDWSPEDREIVIQLALSRLVPDEEAVVDLLASVMRDEQDDFAPRVAAIRALSEHNVFDRFDDWKAAGQSADETVRQAVADNLFRAKDREYGEILKPMHTDAHSLVRAGSIDSQILRRQPTMLDVLDLLLEDHDEWVRFAATEAAAVFKDAPGAAQRSAMLIRLLEKSDNPQDVAGAVLALQSITGETYGFREIDLHPLVKEVDEQALDAFLKDTEGRAQAAQRYRDRIGGATYLDADRKQVLERLLEHADPDNRARAEKLLSEMP